MGGETLRALPPPSNSDSPWQLLAPMDPHLRGSHGTHASVEGMVAGSCAAAEEPRTNSRQARSSGLSHGGS